MLLSTGRAHGSEVIFTFDGDSAGQRPRCAPAGSELRGPDLRGGGALGSQDPLRRLRLSQGDQAIVGLVNSRIPLFEFAIRSVLSQMDACSAGVVQELRASACTGPS